MELYVLTLTAFILVIVATAIHLTMFRAMLFYARRITNFSATHVAFAIIIALVAHLIEISAFAVGIAWLSASGNYGYLDNGPTPPTASDYFYYSAVTYTTVGFGDITPVGQLRFVSAIEALTGLVLSAWTASVIFLGGQKVGQQFLQQHKSE